MNMILKGKLIIIGGHEDKGATAGENLNVYKKKKPSSHFEILGKLISTIPRTHHIIEIIVAASSLPLEMEEMYINSYKQEGFTKVKFIKVENKVDLLIPYRLNESSSHMLFFYRR